LFLFLAFSSDKSQTLSALASKKNSTDPAFPMTRWSLVVDAREGTDEIRHNALEELCEAYWFPAYAFVRRSGRDAEDAKDLTQGFFVDFLERETFSKANPDNGRMRSFLLVALKRYLAKEYARETTKKRGGGTTRLSIDEQQAEGRYQNDLANDLSPDLLFERHWAEALFKRAFAKMEDYFAKGDRAQVLAVLSEFLSGESPDQNYAEAAKTLQLTEGAVRVNVFRMRKRFRKFVEEEIRQTLASPDEFEDELANLYNIFQQ